jgi:hypothetical protein
MNLWQQKKTQKTLLTQWMCWISSYFTVWLC